MRQQRPWATEKKKKEERGLIAAFSCRITQLHAEGSEVALLSAPLKHGRSDFATLNEPISLFGRVDLIIMLFAVARGFYGDVRL